MLSRYDLSRQKFLCISAPEVTATSAQEFKEVKKMLHALDGITKIERDKKENLLIIKHNRKYGRTADIEATLLDALARRGYGACKVVNPQERPVVTSSSASSSHYRF